MSGVLDSRSRPTCSYQGSGHILREVASRYSYRDGAGELGMIASVTQPVCGACTRSRLSADGKLYTCSGRDGSLRDRALVANGESAGDEAAITRRRAGALRIM